MDLEQIEWIELAHDKNQWSAFINRGMNLGVP
jgi:hypothetical protein